MKRRWWLGTVATSASTSETKRRALLALLAVLWLPACGENGLEIPDEPALTDVPSIVEGRAAEQVGRTVSLDDAVATRVVGDYVFWVGGNDGEVPVILETEFGGQGAKRDVTIREGRRYRIEGAVRLVDNVAPDSRLWRLVDDREMDEIRNAGVYVGATRVTER